MFSNKSRRTQSTYKMFISNTNTTINSSPNLSMNYAKPISKSNNVKNNEAMGNLTISVNGYRNTGGLSWGPPTWCFLHTLVEKIKVEHFSILRLEILKNIYNICVNLPCPECSQHAKNYLNGVNFNALKSKEDVKNMLYEFHNLVNVKKGKPLFNRNDLDDEYKNNVLSTTFYNFLVKFKDKYSSNRFIHEDLYRANLSNKIISWYKQNQGYFNE